jgi:uncharacterized protein (DUF58 family)
MSTEGWIYVIGGVLLASLLLHQPLLFLVSLILLLTAGVSRLWDRYCLVGLSYRRTLGQTRAFFGEEVPLTVEIVNNKPLPLAWLEIDDAVPGHGLAVRPGHVGPSHMPGRRLLSMLLSVKWYERIRRHYRVDCHARGYHPFGPATLRAGDVFGFTTQELVVPDEDYLLVYPKVVALDRLGLPARAPFGEVPLTRREWLFEDPLRTVGVREYRAGDSPRRLHWKATARAPNQQLQVKQLEPTTSYRLLVVLNVSTSGLHWAWQGYDPDLLEAAITTAASVASWAVEHGYQVGLVANAKIFRSRLALRIPPSRDPRQLMHMLEALAKVVPMPTLGIDSLVQLEARSLTYGTTVVVVTAVADQPLLQQLTRLRRAGHRPAVLLVGPSQIGSMPLDGVPVHRVRVEETR